MADFDYSQAYSDARAKYESIALALDTDRLKSQEAELEQQASAPGLWDDSEHAQKVMSQLSACQSQLKHLSSAASRLDDVATLIELGQEENDADTLHEAQTEIESIQKDLDQMEIETLMDGEYDSRSAVVTIRSGAGGVDAADFAQMLLRMYLRWAERNGYKAKV
ncbi:PCRF domain-containing protein, partial [Limosilactobacillus reuteri]